MSDVEDQFFFQCRALGLPEPEREFRFHPVRKWRADFAFIPERILIEIEGGTYKNGRHTRPVGYEKDCEKYNSAQMDGWMVLRYTAGMVRSGEAVAEVEQALKRAQGGAL
jgi:very-short-patch-repair endonuclease